MVVLDADHQYVLPWNERTPRVVLSKQTASRGPAFDGLKAGTRVMVGIGRLHDGQFAVVWAGLIDVKAR